VEGHQSNIPLSLSCAIIEDEPLAQELLKKYVSRVSSLDLVGIFDDAIAAFEQLPHQQPDVVFLDINMPEMTGIEFLKAYTAPHPAVVMITANPNHALDGYELGVTDYLLKPVTFDRFLKAIGRVREKMNGKLAARTPAASTKTISNNQDEIEPEYHSANPEFIYFKTDKKLEQVYYNDIVFVEALGDYLKVFLEGRYLVTHLTMKKLIEILPSNRFLRINRSYIVQLRHIKTLEGNSVITTTGQNLVIGPNYRDALKAALKKWSIS